MSFATLEIVLKNGHDISQFSRNIVGDVNLWYLSLMRIQYWRLTRVRVGLRASDKIWQIKMTIKMTLYDIHFSMLMILCFSLCWSNFVTLFLLHIINLKVEVTENKFQGRFSTVIKLNDTVLVQQFLWCSLCSYVGPFKPSCRPNYIIYFYIYIQIDT